MENLCELLDVSCRRYWWRKAIIADERTIRYYRLKKDADKLANGLISKLQVQPGEKVAVLLGNSAVYSLVYFAVLKAGAVVVPINTFLKGDELIYIINQSDTRVLITSNDFYPLIDKIRPELKSVRGVVLTGTDEEVVDTRVSSVSELMKAGSASGIVKPNIDSDAEAVIIYTSGTTGHPKGAMLTHGNLVSNIKSCVAVSLVSKRDRVLLVLPMFHSFTMTVCLLMPLAVGGGVVIISSLHNFKRVFRKMIINGVTVLIGIPPLYALLAKAKVPSLMRILLRIRLAISGAAPLGEQILKQFEKNWKIPLLEGYGLSEASPVVSLNPLQGARKANSIGIPIPGVAVKIVGQDEAELSQGEIGELIVKGPNVMKGYYQAPEATAKAIRGGWLFTGDLGFVDQDGYFYIVDRKKDMILVRGLNVYPREVEQVLLSHQDIAEASVVGREDQGKGEIPVAFVIPKEGHAVDQLQIARFCRERLADYKVPRQVFVREDLPRTPTGKVLKRELKKLVIVN